MRKDVLKLMIKNWWWRNEGNVYACLFIAGGTIYIIGWIAALQGSATAKLMVASLTVCLFIWFMWCYLFSIYKDAEREIADREERVRRHEEWERQNQKNRE